MPCDLASKTLSEDAGSPADSAARLSRDGRPNRDRLAALLASRPALHGSSRLDPAHWELDDEVLAWLFENVLEDQETLETGCGYSTLVFALAGARHTAIAPFAAEHDRVRAWASANEVDLSGVDLRLARAEQLLPVMEPTPLAVVLIDGWHAFPAPFIDWFYTCERLRCGGLVVLDDTQIVTVSILCDFLRAEKGRWRLHTRFERTMVFEKLVPSVMEGALWRTQPYCSTPILSRKRRLINWVRPRAATALGHIPGAKAAAKSVWRAFGGR